MSLVATTFDAGCRFSGITNFILHATAKRMIANGE
jgi:hypothetical protein